MKGRFFVIEGMDGSGTTTQTRLLKAHLEHLGRKVHITSEPTSNPIGKSIRSYLSGQHSGKNLMATLALLFAADRLVHFDEEIGPKLVEGFDVISDRYLLSSLVYQGLDLSSQWVASLNQFATAPDLNIILDIPIDTAHIRRVTRGGGEEIFEKPELQELIRRRYLKLSEQQGMALVDGQGELETVSHRIFEVVRAFLDKDKA